jgi:hypothetical protein
MFLYENTRAFQGVVTTRSITGQQVQVYPIRVMGLCVKIHQVNHLGQQQVSIHKVIHSLVRGTAVNVTRMFVVFVATEKHLKILLFHRIYGFVPWMGRQPTLAKLAGIKGIVF